MTIDAPLVMGCPQCNEEGKVSCKFCGGKLKTCSQCDGTGQVDCKECRGSGQIEIKQCPLKMITEDVWEMIMHADLYKKGLPPVAGGSLDQTVLFVRSAMFFWSKESEFKAKKGIITDG